MTARALATKVLAQIVRDHKTIKAAFAGTAPEDMSQRDRAFAQELVYGVCRWYFDLDQLLNQRLNKPLRTKDQDIHCLLLVGLYQLIHLDTPQHAIVKETVAVTKDLNKNWAKGLVNACLRSAIREHTKENWNAENAVALNQPPWLKTKIQTDWPQQCQPVLAAYCQRPPLSVRVNLSRISRVDYLELLADADIEACALAHAPSAVRIKNPQPMMTLPGFDKGLISAQDQAAQLAIDLLDPRPGERILDACAAPGGKTCHCLEKADGDLTLIALDNEQERLDLVAQNLARQQYEARLICADAADLNNWWDGVSFDKVLLDAPCSASGVIRRHPDIKLHRTPNDIEALADLQFKILDGLWLTLRPGGCLLYVTCSIFKCENDEVIERFRAQRDDCEVAKIPVSWGRTTTHGRQILPGDDDMDGFYFAHLRKKTVINESN